MNSPQVQRTIEAVWKMESARVIAALARLLRDVGLAEEFAQDALVAALEQWPAQGVPANPGAWLMTTAKHRAIDRLRRLRLEVDREDSLAQEISAQLADALPVPERDEGDAAGVEDDLLRLMFVACHPLLSTDARVTLTLRLLGGLTTQEIARAFLVAEATVAQRIVRAKRTLSEAGVPFEVPEGRDLAQRLASVLEVIYLIFNEGYSATAGEDWMRPALCEEALRLGRILAGLAPRQPEVHGLVALMEIQASRAGARRGANGEAVLLMEQDRSRWDRLLIGRGLAALARAQSLGDGGTYTLQAAIAACHARAGTAADTDWSAIVALYDELLELRASPVVALNRAVAVSMAGGPAAGLAALEALEHEQSLQGYHLLPSVRGDLLAKLGRHREAAAEFRRAASLTQNRRERDLLDARTRASENIPDSHPEGPDGLRTSHH